MVKQTARPKSGDFDIVYSKKQGCLKIYKYTLIGWKPEKMRQYNTMVHEYWHKYKYNINKCTYIINQMLCTNKIHKILESLTH